MKSSNVLLNVLNHVKRLCYDKSYKARCVKGTTHFIRNRKMNFSDYILYLISSTRNSLQAGVSAFVRKMHKEQDDYSKQAFSKQRMYIKPEAIWEFVQVTIEHFYKEAEFDTFHGYLVAAVDGIRYNLPNTHELKEKFGEQLTSRSPQVQALGSCLYDVLNGLVLDAQLTGCHSSEGKLAQKHLDALSNLPYDKYLLLFDRGYPSYKLLASLKQHNCAYVMRCSREFLKKIQTESNDCIVTHRFYANRKDSVQMRIITLELPNGDKERLATNLMDDSLTIEDFRGLYHARWGIETKYNDLKNKLEIENFSGKSEIAIRQDYFATIFLANLAAILVFQMRDQVQEARHECNKYQYKQNMNLTISELKQNVLKLLLTNSKAKQSLLLLQISNRLKNAVVPIRPNRSLKRIVRHRSLKFPQNFKRP